MLRAPLSPFLSCQFPLPWSLKVKVKLLGQVQLFATPWTVAYQVPPSMGFSRQEYWSGLSFPSPEDLPNLGIEPRSPAFLVQSQGLMWEMEKFNPWVGKISWRRKWQPTPVLLPRKSHGWRSLVGYSPWGRKESDTTERLHFHFIFTAWRRAPHRVGRIRLNFSISHIKP